MLPVADADWLSSLQMILLSWDRRQAPMLAVAAGDYSAGESLLHDWPAGQSIGPM